LLVAAERLASWEVVVRVDPDVAGLDVFGTLVGLREVLR